MLDDLLADEILDRVQLLAELVETVLRLLRLLAGLLQLLHGRGRRLHAGLGRRARRVELRLVGLPCRLVGGATRLDLRVVLCLDRVGAFL